MASALAFGAFALLAASSAVEAKPMRRSNRWVSFKPETSWVLQAWCNPGVKCSDAPINDESVVDINWYYASESDVRAVRSMGKVAMCYMSAGAAMSHELEEASYLPTGNSMPGYPDLTWLDITNQEPLRRWMGQRLENAAAMGCQAVELDNVDCWQNECLPGQKRYSADMREAQLRYVNWLADKAHNLGMAVGQKNSLMLVEALHDKLDFAVSENCFNWDECHYLDPFVQSGKAVFATSNRGGTVDEICAEGAKHSFSMKYDLGSNGWRDCNSAAGPRPYANGGADNSFGSSTSTNDVENNDNKNKDNNNNKNDNTEEQGEVAGEWARWSSWSGCSRVCGSGVTERNRKCSTGNVSDCFGDFHQRKTCNDFSCGKGWTGDKWNAWGPWNMCSKKCGGGVQTRSRACSTGNDGSCPGDWMDRRVCNTQAC